MSVRRDDSDILVPAGGDREKVRSLRHLAPGAPNAPWRKNGQKRRFLLQAVTFARIRNVTNMAQMRARVPAFRRKWAKLTKNVKNSRVCPTLSQSRVNAVGQKWAKTSIFVRTCSVRALRELNKHRGFWKIYHPVGETPPPFLNKEGRFRNPVATAPGSDFLPFLGACEKMTFLLTLNISTGRFKNGWKT